MSDPARSLAIYPCPFLCALCSRRRRCLPPASTVSCRSVLVGGDGLLQEPQEEPRRPLRPHRQ